MATQQWMTTWLSSAGVQVGCRSLFRVRVGRLRWRPRITQILRLLTQTRHSVNSKVMDWASSPNLGVFAEVIIMGSTINKLGDRRLLG